MSKTPERKVLKMFNKYCLLLGALWLLVGALWLLVGVL